MASKKQSATKKTAQEIREMIACLEETEEFLSMLVPDLYIRTQVEVNILIARINKLIGKPK